MKWHDPAAFRLSYYSSPGFKQKKLDQYAAQATRLHPLVGDWICAAPILACALNDQRYYQGLFDLANARGRLVDALRLCHVPTVMRKQKASEADVWHKLKSWRSTFPEMPDSELAQLLARIDTPHARTEWMARLGAALIRRPAGTEWGEYARWAVRMAATHERAVIYSITDYMKTNEFSLSWTVGQFERADRAWVERMRAEWEMQREQTALANIARQSARSAKLQQMLDERTSYAPFPAEWESSLGKVRALDTPRSLLEEGAKMRHCVGGEQFRSAMRKGRSLFYHLEAGADRSTLELQKLGSRYLIGQHCGPCNARPGAALQHLASSFLAHGLKSASGTLNTNGESNER